MYQSRLKHIRTSDKTAFNASINAILAIEDHRDNISLRTVLEDHWKWHHGEFSSVDDLYMVDTDDDVVLSLASVYRAFSQNTFGRLTESISSLDFALQFTRDMKSKIECYIGESFDCLMHTWRIWNLIEKHDYRAVAPSLSYATNLLKGYISGIKNTTSAQLFLAAGILYLRHGNYSLANAFLAGARDLLKPKSIWLPRVFSALSLLKYWQRNIVESIAYLEAAITGQYLHFGPLGWQLRIAESMYFHGRTDEAIDLSSKIYAETTRKRENIYSIWALISITQFEGRKIGFNEYMSLFSDTRFIEMKRAAAFLIANDMINYDD